MTDKTMKDALDDEEQEILDAFERGELVPVPNVEQLAEEARQAAHNTLEKSKRLQLRITQRDFLLAQERAHEEGVSCQSLLSSVVHKYLSGRLVEKEHPPIQ